LGSVYGALPSQVREFSELVARACNEGESAIAYEPCSEHAHSNCMLLGHPSMKQGGGDGEAEFATWIDYARFHQLVSSGEPFTAADYMAPTPEWACYRTEYTGKSAGFDPAETRWHRHSGVALSKCHLRVIIIVIGTLD
jgi:tRNA wybutosine-synthesizing protein 1